MKLLSIIFSFRNEEKNIPELVRRIKESLKKSNNWKYELVFVNDDSTDSSEKVLSELQNDHPIKIINMSRKFGVGPCVLAGFDNCNGDCIIYMDTDLQDPPELIPNLIKKYEEGYDIIHTKRIKRIGENKLKMFVTKLAYKIINKLSDISLPVEVGDFKLISRRALNQMRNQREFNPYIRGMSVWVGFKQTFVEYVRQERVSGKTKQTLFSADSISYGPISQFIKGVTSYSLAPLYLGIILGMFAFSFSILLIFYALYTKFSGLAVAGSTGVIITVSFFSGIILITMGIIGIYIARIYEQTRGRVKYIIKEIKDYKNIN